MNKLMLNKLNQIYEDFKNNIDKVLESNATIKLLI